MVSNFIKRETMSQEFNIAILGATGAVGETILEIAKSVNSLSVRKCTY